MGADFDVSGLAVIAERVKCRGQFPLKLGIGVRDEALWERVQGTRERVQIVKRLCRALGAAAILARDELNGELDYLIRPTGVFEVEVGEGPTADEYVLVSARQVQDSAA